VGRFKGIMVKNVLPNRRQALCGSLLLSVACAIPSRPGVAGGPDGVESEAGQVVVDWRTGLALYGMDPVAYFAVQRAVPGLPEFEVELAGRPWRFASSGNKAAFLAAPEAYVPAFAGYDPVAAGRAVAAPGNPLIWLIFEQRLYLFQELENRAAFAADPHPVIATALRHWPKLRQELDATGAIAGGAF